MLKYTTYLSDILCLPSGRVLTVSKRTSEKLKEKKLIKWKRNIKFDNYNISIHGYICDDENVEEIEEIDRKTSPF